MIKSRRLRWAGYVVRMEEGRSGFKILSGKPIGKRPLIQLRIGNAALNLRVSYAMELIS